MIQRREKIVFFTVFSIAALLGGCSDSHAEEFRQEHIDYLGGIYKSETRFWDSKGFLVKTTIEYSAAKPFTEFYKKPTVVELEGKQYQKYEVDKYKTYKDIATSEWLKKSKSKAFIYVDKGKAFFSISEKRGDGVPMIVSFYEDDGRLSKIYEDKNGDGFFDVVDVLQNGKTISEKNIKISVKTSLAELQKFQA